MDLKPVLILTPDFFSAFDENQHVSSRPETSGIQEMPSALPGNTWKVWFVIAITSDFNFKNGIMLVKFNMTQNNFRTVVIKLLSQIPD